MRELQEPQMQNQRQWTDEDIRRARLTEPPSPCSYISPAGAYVLGLHPGDVLSAEPKFDFNLSELPQDRN